QTPFYVTRPNQIRLRCDTSGSTRGRRAADLICYSSSYSTGHSFSVRAGKTESQASSLSPTGFTIKYVPLQSGNSARGIDGRRRAASSRESARHDRAGAIEAGPGRGPQQELSGLPARVRRAAKTRAAGARRAG